MKIEVKNAVLLGDMEAVYLLDHASGLMGFELLPAGMYSGSPIGEDSSVDSMVQLYLTGDVFPAGFSGGHTMRNGESCNILRFQEQKISETGESIEIRTYLGNSEICACHIVSYQKGSRFIGVKTELANLGKPAIQVEMLSSFSLCNLFDFQAGDRAGDILLHRLQSKWTMEGRLESRTALELQMEADWQGYGAQSIRFGQVGTMPVRRYFPWFALEDRRFHCVVGGMLSYAGSWQMEFYGKGKRTAFSGGLADYEFGHWRKKLLSGEKIVTPAAYLAVCEGSLNEFDNRLQEVNKVNIKGYAGKEKELPVVFNEFCTSWGRPQEENILNMLDLLKGKGIGYFVIDAGWYAKENGDWENSMGDWEVSKSLFPHGMKTMADSIRKAGMIPGIWFEFETCGSGSEIYRQEDMLLKRDGYPLTTFRRRFLDFRNPKVVEYLRKRVTGFLKDNGIGYLKIDYNDTLGLGCDGAESLGEGLRQQVQASYRFFEELKETLPDLVIEICASGGHRLEPSMLRLCDMASFSDAHECVYAPIVAANVLRVVPAAKNLIWAVMRKDHTLRELRYRITAAFLGRICLSGDIRELTEEQWAEIERGLHMYREAYPYIRDGRIKRIGPEVCSYNDPKGYQAVCFETEEGILVALHGFSEAPETVSIKIPTGKKCHMADVYSDESLEYRMTDGFLKIIRLNPFDGAVFLIEKSAQRTS